MEENVLYDPLPEEWNGYQLNTWFQVGIQVFITTEDKSLSDYERNLIIIDLLFGYEDEFDSNFKVRPHPQGEELAECFRWFVNGWHHDNSPTQKSNQKVMDYYKDQWRIYADFRQIYGINLNDADLHWWEFCGLLWNMPFKQSSFMHAISARKRKITKGMSKEEKEIVLEEQHVLALEQPEKKFTKEQESKIDAYDRMMKKG